jgi:hypothetical protein
VTDTFEIDIDSVYTIDSELIRSEILIEDISRSLDLRSAEMDPVDRFERTIDVGIEHYLKVFPRSCQN